MIKANFNTYASYVTDSLYQWDLNQVLSVSGLNLSVVPEVHFSNANMDKAIVRQATKVNNVVSVQIPNSLLQDPLTIYAHIGIYEGDTFKVVERVDIPVIPKKRPSDYQIQGSDEEIYSFQALENAIANMVKAGDFNANNVAVASRIDNIIAHNNDTEGNTELLDIRTDSDGNTHASAGAAVRFLGEKIKESKLNYSEILTEINGYYVQNTGAVYENESYSISEPITVPGGYTVKFVGRGYKTSVAMISELNSDGSYTPLVISIDSEDREYSYTTVRETKIVFSWSISRGYSLSVVGDLFNILSTHTENVATSVKNDLVNEDYISLSLFSKFGVIGDSYASGEMYFDGSFHDIYEVSWGQILARKLGTTCVNFSAGGLSTKGWLTNDYGLPLLLATEPQDIYYLALGINDANNYGADYLGSLADINKDDFTLNADSFYGNYGKIIGNIKTHAPNAKIIMSSMVATTDMKARYNDAIAEIAAYFEIPYIVQENDQFFVSDWYKNGKVQSHPVAVVYSGMAEAFERLIKKCILNNYEYFSDSFMY